MNYEESARKILSAVGGAGNIKEAAHCMTRLRLILKDDSLANDQAVRDIPGVIGTNKAGGQYQIIMGNEVPNYYHAFSSLLPKEAAPEESDGKKKKRRNPFSVALDFIAGCMTPILPAIIAGGLVKVLLVLLSPTVFNVMTENDQLYTILYAIGDAPFYFLPMLLAVSASQKLGSSTFLTLSLAGFLLYPDLMALLAAEEPVSFIGIPVVSATYTSSVIPILLAAILLRYVEIVIDKITPSWTKSFLKPLLILLITAPVTLVAIGPLGAIIGDGLAFVLDRIYSAAPWLAMTIFAGLMPFIVMTGMHYAFLPTALGSLATLGYEVLLIPAMLASNLAQGAASAAVAVKTKDEKLRQTAFPAAISALFAGVTEPALYGVTLRKKGAIISACIGGAAAGLFAGLINLKSYASAVPSVTSIVQFISPDGGNNFIYALITAGITIGVTFLLTLILVREPKEVSEKTKETTRPMKVVSGPIPIANPVGGKILPLSSVKDATFSSGVLGFGYAVEPDGDRGRVIAPFDGVVDSIPDTFHAIGMTSDNGVNLLVHVGLETVTLGGRHFSPHVKDGDRIRRGQTLLEFDAAALRAEGYDTTTPVIVTNATDYASLSLDNVTRAGEGSSLLSLTPKGGSFHG